MKKLKGYLVFTLELIGALLFSLLGFFIVGIVLKLCWLLFLYGWKLI